MEPTVNGWPCGRKNLCLIPDGVDDVSAAGIPVAYLTAKIALTLAGFQAGKTARAGDRRIGRQRGDAIAARSGRKTRNLKHDQSCEVRTSEGARIQGGH